jgi:hypothetical protein
VSAASVSNLIPGHRSNTDRATLVLSAEGSCTAANEGVSGENIWPPTGRTNWPLTISLRCGKSVVADVTRAVTVDTMARSMDRSTYERTVSTSTAAAIIWEQHLCRRFVKTDPQAYNDGSISQTGTTSPPPLAPTSVRSFPLRRRSTHVLTAHTPSTTVHTRMMPLSISRNEAAESQQPKRSIELEVTSAPRDRYQPIAEYFARVDGRSGPNAVSFGTSVLEPHTVPWTHTASRRRTPRQRQIRLEVRCGSSLTNVLPITMDRLASSHRQQRGQGLRWASGRTFLADVGASAMLGTFNRSPGRYDPFPAHPQV